MFEDTKYTINQYLFDIENYITLCVESKIVLPIHIWRDIFEQHGTDIFTILSGNIDKLYVSICKRTSDDRLGIKLIYSYVGSDIGTNSVTYLSDNIISKIRSYERNEKIDELCKQ